ncbi:hypothetical protein [Bacillus sp. T3]|uniref:hypothetical protein n=1 Tax=Bacillus sp. T3 TaxID=467262 RepID=UPI002981494D|nr:hypothetical protein [Bacillus sp. T3]
MISKHLTIKKILIISRSDEASLEVPLHRGLNIILGKNKTGKSSLIKTIFYSFGCEVKFDEDWEKLNKRSLVIFSVGDKDYLLERQDNTYVLFKTTDDLKSLFFQGSFSFSDFSKKFLELFNINATWIDKNGKEQPITPPHLFSFQYIDQDKGWHSIARSFNKVAYISNWDTQIIKYIIGYQTEEYFKHKKEIEKYKILIKEIEIKIKNIEDFVSDLIKRDQHLDEADTSFIEDDLTKSKNILDKLTNMEKERIAISNELSLLQNDQYEKKIIINSLTMYSEELIEDHNFASTLDEKITCPFCGVIHNNEIIEKSEIIKDIQTATNILTQATKELEQIGITIDLLDQKYNKINSDYEIHRKELIEIEEKTNAINTIKNEGKNELILSSYDEIKNIRKNRDEYLGLKEDYQSKIKSIESRKRQTEITQSLKEYMNLLFEKLDLSGVSIKFRSFMPVIKKTGSELPRVIYSYYIALYLYNLSTEATPFKFLVIDTPNQQGQDENNLQNINSALELLLSDDGQVIIGSERSTGVEHQAANLIRLTNYKKCLTKDMYSVHNNFLKELDQIREKALLN